MARPTRIPQGPPKSESPIGGRAALSGLGSCGRARLRGIQRCGQDGPGQMFFFGDGHPAILPRAESPPVQLPAIFNTHL